MEHFSSVADSGTIVSGNLEVDADQFAGRDLINQNTYYFENTSGFADINLAAYTEELYITPNFTDVVLQQATDHRLVLIAGESDFDKHDFVRHLAQRISLLPGTRFTKEWSDPEDANKMLQKIKEFSDPVVFILPNTAPKDINYDPVSLSRLAKERGHYFLLTTDISRETWNMPQAFAGLYWFDVPLSGLYSKEKLTEILVKEILSVPQLFGIAPDAELQASYKLAEGYTIASVAASFERPSEINFFITQLCADKSTLTADQKLRAAIRSATDKKESLVSRWFQTLDPHKRLVVLGAALLDGLFDDQYFAVMQKIVDDFWHYRSKEMYSLDYCDLDFLLNFFKFGELDDGRLVLESKFPNQRAEIIRAAWAGHKRHILSAFAIITSLAGSSSARAASRVKDPEINGTDERGKRLRAVTAETISDIGIVSLQTAEPKLLSLASSGDQTTRRITAKAVARWRAFHSEDQMFALLGSWSKKNSSTVRNSVIYTLQYAAEYDSPGNLEPRVMQILNELAGQEGTSSTMNTILERLMQYHLPQIKDDLFEHFVIHQEYSFTISRSLADLYPFQPHLIKQLLEEWLTESLDQSSQRNRRDKPTYRDTVVQSVLLVYQLIPYANEDDVIPIGYVWNLLNNLHSTEQRRSMRLFVLQTAASLISTQPEQAIRYIEPLFAKIGLEERMELIRSIGNLYLRQRAELSEGDLTILLDGVEYAAWTQRARPVTRIETILTGWLQGGHAFARQVATLAFVEFARALDLEEPRLIQDAIMRASLVQQERMRQEQQRQFAQAVERAVNYPVMPQLSLWSRIKIFFWLLFRDANEKVVLRELMQTLLMYKITNPALLQTLINRWSRSRNARLEGMAWWIGKLMRL